MCLLESAACTTHERARSSPCRSSAMRTWLNTNHGFPGKCCFRKGISGRWTHHVHIAEPSGARWEEFILIRDYLRKHPEVAGAYGDLKKGLATRFGEDIAGFRSAKGPFLRELMAKAHADT